MSGYSLIKVDYTPAMNTPDPSGAGRGPDQPPGARRPWLPWTVLAALAAGVAILFVWEPGSSGDSAAQGRGGPRATPVAAAPVETGPLTERATYPGELDADAAEVASSVAGRLVAVDVRIGDQVTQGQALARVDGADLVRQRAEAAAAARVADAAELRATVQLQAAERELQRAQALFGQGTISEQERDRLSAEVDALGAQVQAAAAQEAQAQARVAVLDQKITETRLRAPFAGTVAMRHHDPGNFVSAGASVVRIVAHAPLRVRFDLPEQDVGRFAADTAFTVRAPPTGAREIPGRVTGFGTEVDRERRIVRIEGELTEPPDTWLPGMYAEVVAAQRTIERATIVPAAALVSRLQAGSTVQQGVFRPEDGQARWVPVRVLARDGDRVAVETIAAADSGVHDGVQAGGLGTQVLTSGHTDLADGAPITLTEQ